jgi:hypothetical protein
MGRRAAGRAEELATVRATAAIEGELLGRKVEKMERLMAAMQHRVNAAEATIVVWRAWASEDNEKQVRRNSTKREEMEGMERKGNTERRESKMRNPTLIGCSGGGSSGCVRDGREWWHRAVLYAVLYES